MMELWKLPAEKIDIVPCACSDTLHREQDSKRLQKVKEQAKKFRWDASAERLREVCTSVLEGL